MTERVLFEETIRETHAWLAEVSGRLEIDPHEAWTVVKAVLHALRDRVTVEEAAQLAAQLPTLLRGAYYEGFRPGHGPGRERTKEEFLAKVASNLKDLTVDSEAVTRAVLATLVRHVSPGEIDDVRQNLPQEIRDLF